MAGKYDYNKYDTPKTDAQIINPPNLISVQKPSAPVDFNAVDVKPVKTLPLPPEATTAGIIDNTIWGLPVAAAGVAKDIFQGFNQFVASYALSARDILRGGEPSGEIDFGKVADETSPVLGRITRAFFGEEPSKDVATRLKEAYDSPLTQKIASYLPAEDGIFDAETNRKLNGVKIAALGVIGGDALNFIGGGSGAVEKQIIESTADDVSLAILKRLGLSDELATKFTPVVTAARTPEEAKAIVNAVKYAQGAQAIAETAPAGAVAKQIREQFPTLPAREADRIAMRALQQDDYLKPGALDSFVQKEIDAYKPVVTTKTTSRNMPLREESRFQSPEDILREMGRPKQGAQGVTLNRPEMQQLLDFLKDVNDPALTKERGVIYTPYAPSKNNKFDVILGETGFSPGRPEGGKVVAELNDNGKLTGRFRIHATPLDESKVVERLMSEDLPRLLPENPQRVPNETAVPQNNTEAAAQSIPEVSTDAPPETAEEAVAGYWEDVISKQLGSGKTIEVSGDEMKRFYGGDYDPMKSDLYAKAAFETMKRLTVDPEVKTFVWLGGGPGAGKSEFIGEAVKAGNLADVLYDTTLTSAKGARELIQLAKKNGKEIDVRAILANLQEARRHTLIREGKTGRPVTDEAFADRHTKFPQALAELLEDGTLSKEQVSLYDLRNIRYPDEARQMIRMGISQADPLAVLRKVRYDKDVLKTEYAKQRFTPEDLGRTSDTPESRAARGFSRGNRPDNGQGSGGVGDEVRKRKTPVGAGSAEAEPRVTPARAAQEEAAAKAGPDARAPLPPSIGEIMLENGRKVGTDQTPADTIAAIADGPEQGSWQSLVRGYMYNHTPEKRAHVLDYLATPEYVLEKVGLGKGAELLHDAQDRYLTTLKTEFDTIQMWKNQVEKEPYSARLIFQYLDGQDGQEKEVYDSMTEAQGDVAMEIRAYLKDWAARLALPEDKQISRYITHIFERDFNTPAEDAFVDPELAAILSEKVAKSVYDPFLLKRTGKRGYVEDVWRALDAYVKRAARKEAMDPALDALSAMAKDVDDRTYNYIKKLSHRVNMRPTELEQAMDSFITQTPLGGYFTNRPTAFLSRKMRQIFYRGTLGLNVSSALRNLSQGANTYAKLGEKYTTIGYAKLFGRMATRNLDELFDQNVLSDSLIQDRNIGVIRKGAQMMDKGLFSIFDMAEKINRGAAYYGAKSKGLNKGLSEEQAIKYAKRMVRETQFAFGAVDTPVALNDDVIKTMTQLQTYNIKQIEFLGRMLKQKDFIGLTRWTGATLAFLYTIGKVFGMTLEQIVPTIGIGGAPFTSTVTNIPGLFSEDPQVRAKAQSQLKRNLSTLVPAGAQIRKTVQGALALEEGKTRTPTGEFRFRVDPEDAAQALIFGPNSLPQAREYFDSIGKKKEVKKGNRYNP